MFREMLRKKQQLPEKECIDLLKTELRGVLSVLGDDVRDLILSVVEVDGGCALDVHPKLVGLVGES